MKVLMETLDQIFRALRSKNYRLFFGGQSISLVGSWLTRVAMSWLVFRLSRSALVLGLVGFASQIPTFFIVPIAGVLVDRWRRQPLLIVTQVLLMIQALLLAFLTLRHKIAIWHIFALSLFQGIVNAFDIPARQAFVVEMVEKREDLANAIALNSSMFNMARLVGPSAAGILIASVGEGICFLIDGLSYWAVIFSLAAMKIRQAPPPALKAHVGKEMREGFHHAFGFAPIRAILFLVAAVSLLGLSYIVLLPIFTERILHGGPQTLGFLTASSGVGALAGGLYLASRKNVLGLGRVIVFSTFLGGLSLILFSGSHHLRFSLLFIMTASFGMMVQMASCNTILQTIVDDDKRGRVMSFYTMAFLGMAPFGSLLAGAIAQKFGAPMATMIGGGACVAAAALFNGNLPALRERIRPIYIKKGIIPEIATGIQTAANLSSPKD